MSGLAALGTQLYGGPEAAAPVAGTFPFIGIEIEFTPGVWTDVSDDLMSGSITRGKQRELDRYQAGRSTITLENSDRLYDPTYSAGSYYGNLKPNKRIRITATYAAVTFALFAGYINSIRQQSTGPNSNRAVIQASDGFKKLNSAALASSAYAQEVLNDGPVRWYRLGEPVGSTVFFDSIGDDDLTINGVPTLSDTGLVAREANSAMKITADSQGAQRTGPATSRTAITVEFVFRYDSDGAIYGAEVNGIATQGWTMIRVGTDIHVNVFTDTTSLNTLDASGIQDGAIHHFAFTWDGATVITYLDGVATDFGACTGTLPQTTVLSIGGIVLDSVLKSGQRGSYQEFAIYDYALSAAQVAAHAEAVTTPWNNDTPGERAARVLDAIGWPDSLRELDTGISTLQSASLNQSALEHLQKVAESEFGLLYMTKEGRVRLEQRTNLINQVSQGTFTDAHGSDPAIVIAEPEISDSLIRNDVTVSRVEGVAQNAQDAVSISENGPVSYTRDGLFHDSDELSRYAAQFIVSEYKDALQRIESVVIKPRGNPSVLFPQVLGRELSDLITLAETPQGVGSEYVQDSVIEGITHTFGPLSWETVWSVSPAYAGEFLELDDTDGLGLDFVRIYF